MTPEKRMLFDLSEVRSVVFECGECEGRFSFPRGQTLTDRHQLMKCPYCSTEWLGSRVETQAMAYKNLLDSIMDTENKHEDRKPGFSVRLEFNDPS